MLANGNMGIEGNHLALGNVYLAITYWQKSAGTISVDNFWTRGLYSSGNYYSGAGGHTSLGYGSMPGFGPLSHGTH